MIRLTLIFLLLLTTPAKAKEYCNSHEFKFAFFKIYDVFLCSEKKENLKEKEIFQHDFSLKINYAKNIKAHRLAKISIKEMRRYYQIGKKDGEIYYQKLLKIFPNVKIGDEIKAKYFAKTKITKFYHNEKFLGQIKDSNFSKMFLNIWLHPKNHHKKLNQDLFSHDQ